MFRYTYNELFDLIDDYNKKHKTNININELLDPKYRNIQKLGFLDKKMFDKYEPNVIYEDSDFFGIYKPPYWIVNVGNPNKDSFDVLKNMDKNLLQVWLYKNLKYPLREDIDRGYGICNRLDINTSGIVIVAKDAKNYKYLRKEISDHKNTRKKYFSLVVGRVEAEEGGYIQSRIDCVKGKGTSKCYNNPKGMYSKTQYLPIDYLKDGEGNNYTLMDVKIYTGRTHQIRVHMKMLNTHIISDNLYSSSKEIYEKHRKLCPRIFLHAYYYSFLNMKGQRVEIFSPLADDLLESLKNNFIFSNERKREKILKFVEDPGAKRKIEIKRIL